MKRIFAILTIIAGLVLPMQAQLAPVSKDVKVKTERKMVKKAFASAEVTAQDLVGKYSAYAMSAFQGNPDETWTVNVTLDETDANKLWIEPICLISGSIPSAPVYATLNANGTLSLPMGQCVYKDDSFNLVLGTSEDGKTIDTESDIIINVSMSDTKIELEIDVLFGVGDIDTNEWWYQALGYTTFTRTLPVPTVYIYGKNDANGVPTRVKTTNLYFNEIEGETYVTTTKTISTDPICGSYEAYAMSAFQGEPDENWTVTITRDEVDANKLWIHPICLFSGLTADEINPVYATYDEAAGTITLPMGQCVYSSGTSYNMVLGTSVDGTNVDTEGNLVMNVINSSTNIAIELDAILGVGNLAETNGWWYQALAYIEYTKDGGIAIPLADIEKITRQAPDAPITDGFFSAGNYTWDFQFSPDGGESWNALTSVTTVSYTDMFDLGLIYQDASGIIATQWSVDGFLVDLGFFEDGTPSAFPAIEYNMDYEGVTYTFIDIIDPETGSACIGQMPLQSQDGSSFTADIYLGEYDGQYLYYNVPFMVDEGDAYYAGEQPILWFETGGQPYILALFSDIVISNSTANAAAPARRIKSATVNMLKEPIPVQKGGFKRAGIK